MPGDDTPHPAAGAAGAGGRAGVACDVWWVATGRLDWPRLAAVLDAGEAGRLAALRREADRERFVLAAALARAGLAQRLGVAATDVRLDRRCSRCGAPHGRPRLAAPAAPLGLSITHSGALVGVAVADGGDVGLDAESAGEARDVAGVARSVLNATEQAALERHAAGDDPRLRAEGFLRLWTRKEALTKMIGRGLTVPLADIHVSGPAEPAALLSWAGHEQLVTTTTLCDLPVPVDGHVAALAVAAPGAVVHVHDGAPLLAFGPSA